MLNFPLHLQQFRELRKFRPIESIDYWLVAVSDIIQSRGGHVTLPGFDAHIQGCISSLVRNLDGGDRRLTTSDGMYTAALPEMARAGYRLEWSHEITRDRIEWRITHTDSRKQLTYGNCQSWHRGG